jgi:hypothetical protein
MWPEATAKAPALAGRLLAVDSAACLVVARLFNCERFISGARLSRAIPSQRLTAKEN